MIAMTMFLSDPVVNVARCLAADISIYEILKESFLIHCRAQFAVVLPASIFSFS